MFNEQKYVREETIVPECFAWQHEPNKLIDVHTISWKKAYTTIRQNDELSAYFSSDYGWSGKDGTCDKSNPAPEIEQIFKKTVGKDLIYFQ